jgi:hypothetical protein
MNTSQENSQLHQAIDAEIKSLDSEESIRALKRRRNALSPVSSLPPEMIADIFSLLCIPSTSFSGGNPDYHLARLSVSHVCHRWRDIALNQPLLWNHVDFTNLSMTGAAEILVRAKSAPLYLEASIFGKRWDNARFSAFLKELQPRVPHIYHLKTSAESAFLHGILEGLVSPAPALEYLSLSSHRPGVDRHILERRPSIHDTLFDSSTPRLSCLELSNCNISWRSPLLKGLKNLEILSPSADTRPKLAVWLDALDEMRQLTSLTLHFASPAIAPHFPFVIQRIVTIHSLARLDILAFPEDCALALAHLDLPALTSLCLTAIYSHRLYNGDTQRLLPYVVRHAHGPQDTQPLQSVLISSGRHHADLLAWPVPDIDVQVHDLPTSLAATLPTRVALSFRCNDYVESDTFLDILDTMMTGLPLDGLVMVAAHDLCSNHFSLDLGIEHFWLHLSPKWPLLQRVRLSHSAAIGFVAMLLADNRRRERPLLPSLRELVIVDLSSYSLRRLCDALMKRVEQGVPVETLDLRMCIPHPEWAENWFQLLSEIVVDVLGPVETLEAREKMESRWKTVARGPFMDNANSRKLDHSVTESDEDSESDTESDEDSDSDGEE